MKKDLLIKARDYIKTIPSQFFNLRSVYDTFKGIQPECGTIACAAGWIALNPEFNALGLTCDPDSVLQPFRLNGKTGSYKEIISALFEIEPYQAIQLFGVRYEGYEDNGNWELIDKYIPSKLPNDKDLFLARCAAFFEEHGVENV